MNRPLLLIHHANNRGKSHPPNSIIGLKMCLEAGARIVEVDISPLSDGDFILLHDRVLDGCTNGSGLVGAHTSDEVSGLRLVWRGGVTSEPVGLLSQAVDLVSRHPNPVELQLDLKPYTHLDKETRSRLVDLLRPVKNRVRVTSEADWTLRSLHALDDDLPLGFDPWLYLDVIAHREGAEFPVPPFRQGAYEYWDDHPLASVRWGGTADYLAARAEALWAQSPPGAVWYIHAKLLARVLDDGFDWIADLHERGAQVTAWTLNVDRPPDVELAWRLAMAGMDRITTDDAPALARALSEHAKGTINVAY